LPGCPIDELVTRYRDLPIRRKLLLTTLISTAAALTLASAGFLGWDIVQFRSAARQDVMAQSAIVAENSGAPLAFGDDRVGREILATLQVWPRLEMACLYEPTGRVFTTYYRDRGDACPSPHPQQSIFGWEAFEVVVPVTVERERVGTLYIRRELTDLYARLRVGTATVLSLLLIAAGMAIVTGTRMQQSIASPLLELAETARAISTTRDYSLRATPASNDEIGMVMRAFNEMLDRIAEALERERTANRLKDEFLATLSHELRTPLNAVLGWTRILRSTRLEQAAQSKALEAIERNARAQALLVEDLLDMSAIVSGKPRFNARDVDLAAIVDAAIEVSTPAAAAKRLRLHVNVVVRPALTFGDPGRLQQIAWNLLSNAIKFTPAGRDVWVTLAREDGYRLSVRDNGAGIDPAFLALVFEPFRQEDGSVTREHGGLGLGLAITKQLVELHGGRIVARSPGPGAGATFDVYLPSVVTDAAAAAAREPAGAPR
jgi:signal transduction histidine kinase